METLNIISERVAQASSRLIECEDCTICCERSGLVYLFDEEVDHLSSLGVPIFSISGVNFIKRFQDGTCPMLNRDKKECSIYEYRPLCCRLFPLDLVSINGKLFWALSTLCPEDRKCYELCQDPYSKIGFGSIVVIVSFLETFLGENKIAFLKRKERLLANIEILEEDQNNWIPIAELNFE